MNFRKSTLADAPTIIQLIKQAQMYFKQKNINQWQNGYPNMSVVEKDIDDQNGYVLIHDNHTIIGTVTVSFDGETTYHQIYEGQWKSNGPFAVIHRIAIDNDYKGQGYSTIMLKEIVTLCLNRGVHSIKVDTHEDNKSMQQLLRKNHFSYCGIIYLADDSKRIAFEKLI